MTLCVAVVGGRIPSNITTTRFRAAPTSGSVRRCGLLFYYASRARRALRTGSVRTRACAPHFHVPRTPDICSARNFSHDLLFPTGTRTCACPAPSPPPPSFFAFDGRNDGRLGPLLRAQRLPTWTLRVLVRALFFMMLCAFCYSVEPPTYYQNLPLPAHAYYYWFGWLVVAHTAYFAA